MSDGEVMETEATQETPDAIEFIPSSQNDFDFGDGEESEEPIPDPATEDAGEASAGTGEHAEEGDSSEPPSEPEPVKVSPEVTALAKGAGLTDEDIAAFPSQAALDRTVAMLARRGLIGGPERNAPQPAQPAPAQPAEDWGYKVPLSKEEYEPAYVEAIEGLNNHVKSVVGELRAQLGAMSRYVGAQQVREQASVLDARIAELPESVREVFGAGSSLEMDPASPAYQKRDEVFKTAQALGNAYVQIGQRPPSFKTLVERALHSLHGESIVKATKTETRQEIAKAVESRNNTVIGRPSGRKGNPAKPGLAAASEFYNDFIKKHGSPDEPIDDF